ncbi:MAG: HAMP domain-containing histidine kinase [Alistipes sp.]|nr:HAMP domain-containing histidine kinase [Alistipes sp.]
MNKKKKNKNNHIPLHKSFLGYKIMGLTILTFLITLGVYFGFAELGNYFAKTYSTIEKYTPLIQTVSIFMAFVCFFWIFLAFLRSTVSDIKHLSSDLKRITGGELERQISLSRKDELGDLARDISIMQHSLIERMEKEREAVKSNRNLITSLSHDLRTPLTKQMCAIELALKGDCGKNEQLRKSLMQIYHHSEQIKEISDELFSYFLVEDNAEQGHIHMEVFDGNTLFAQLLSEYSDFLESSGFTVKLNMPQTETFKVTVDASYLARILDNLASNIRKYADKNHDVRISLLLENDIVSVRFSNVIRADDGKMLDSSNIGIYSAKNMAEMLGGELNIAVDDDEYCAELKLKTADKN